MLSHARALLALALAVALVATAAPATATFPGDNGAIVFDRSFDGGDEREIGAINPDGTDLRTLALGSDSRFASFAADGSRFVYTCGGRICSAGADGSNPVTFSGPAGRNTRWPGLSANGKRLVFVTGNTLMVARADGSRAKSLRNAGKAWQPEFFPDGDRIAFSRAAGKGHREIYSIGADGRGLKRLSRSPKGIQDINPSISPDGRRIAFERNDDRSSFAVWTMRSNGGNPKRLLRKAGTPAYSPDGKLIAHQALFHGLRNSAIAISDADGSNTRRLTEGSGSFDNLPTWQPLP